MSISDEVLGRFTRALSLQSSADLPRRMCGAFAEVIGADGAAISLGSVEEARSLLAATDERTEQLHDLQDMVGEGPSIDAIRGGGPAVMTSTEGSPRDWPMLAEALRRQAAIREVRALYAFPMRPQSEVLGVLSAHQVRDSSLKVSLEEAQVLADAVGVAVLGDLGPGSDTEHRWLQRDRISQAIGMVIAQLGVPAPDAAAVLRAHAYAIDASLSEVSRRVLERSLRFSINPEEDS